MVREIILVEVVNQDDMSTDKSKAFTKTEKAEEYFKKILREDIHLIDEDDIEDALDNGYYDDPDDGGCGTSVIIKEISFEDD
jgi:hypothetical protein